MKLLTSILGVVLVEVLLSILLFIMPMIVLGASLSDIRSAFEFYPLSVGVTTLVILIPIGIPTYFLMRHLKQTALWKMGLLGFCIGIVFYLLFTSPYPPGNLVSSGQNIYGTYRDTVINGERTFWGWFVYLEMLLMIGIHGLVGSITFTVIMKED